eukprot:16350845-Heterocapsa_arctica.AAC.1
MRYGRHNEHPNYTHFFNGECLLCGAITAGVNHIRWECPTLNKFSNLGLQHLNLRRLKEDKMPYCFWNTGVITKDWTTLPNSERMNDEDRCHFCVGNVKKVYIDGSATKVGASTYAGRGIWTPDEQSFNDN